jgi:hypothetical protein
MRVRAKQRNGDGLWAGLELKVNGGASRPCFCIICGNEKTSGEHFKASTCRQKPKESWSDSTSLPVPAIGAESHFE